MAFLCVAICAGCSSPQKKSPTRAATKTAKTPKKASSKSAVLAVGEAKTRYRQGVDFYMQSEFEKAREAFTQAAAVLEKSEQARYALPYYGMGLSSMALEKPESAANAFAKALALKPGFALAHHGLGRSQRLMGKYNDAERSYLAALRYGGNDAQLLLNVYFNLGILYDVHLSKPQMARQYYQQYLSAGGPESAKVQSWLQFLKP